MSGTGYCDCSELRKKVRGLEGDIEGYKAQIASQAHYIECLLAEVKQLKEASK